jgi:hypothetical protein
MQNTPNIGFDKLTVSTPDFSVNSALFLNISGITKKAGETQCRSGYLFTDGMGNAVHGGSAYLNTADINFTIKPLGQKIQAILVINPNKLNGLNTLCTDTAHAVMLNAVLELNKLGIDIDLNTALVSRLDICTDAELKYNFREYRGLIIGKTTLKKANSVNYTDSLTFGIGKGTSQFQAYDKGKEREVSQYGRPLSVSTPHTRFEARIFKNAGIKSKVSEATTYNSFLNTPDKAFHKAYVKVISTHVQIQQTQLDIPDITSVVDMIKLLMKQYPKGWLDKAKYNVVTAYLDKNHSERLEIFTAAVEIAMSEHHRTQRDRALKNIQIAETQSSFLRRRLVTDSVDLRYDKQSELFDTFIAPFQYAV